MIHVLLLQFQFKADRMQVERYDGSFIYYLHGNVWLKTPNYEITANKGIYYERDSLAKLYGNITVRGKDYIMKSDYLEYRRGGEYISLIGKVFLEDSMRIIQAETIRVLGKLAKAKGNLYIFMKNRNIEVRGDSGYYDTNAKIGKVWSDTVHARVMRVQDTVDIRGSMMGVLREDIWITPLFGMQTSRHQARGDSAYYRLTEDSLEVLSIVGEAWILWEGGEGSADTIVVWYKRGNIVKVEFLSSADVEYVSEGKIYSMKAFRIVAHFREDKLKEVLSEELYEGIVSEIHPSESSEDEHKDENKYEDMNR